MSLKQLLQDKQQNEINELYIRPNFSFHDNVNRQVGAESVTNNGSRYYIVDGGIKLPSVTTVLGATKSEKDKASLEAWKKRVGLDEAEKIVKESARRGHKLHTTVEKFILDDPEFKVAKYGTNDYHLFRQIHPLLKRVNNIHNLEGALYSKRLGIAGRVDCVAEFDGILSIIDFKSARNNRKEEWLGDYYCQETAYALMFSEMYGIKVKQIVTLMAIDGETQAEGDVFIKKSVDFVEPLLKRVKLYHMTNK